MQQFNLTVFRQNRALLLVIIFPASILSALIIAASIDNLILQFLIPIVFLGLIGWIFYYFVVGFLTVEVKGRELEFMWTRKILFNYKDIAKVDLDNIKTLVIDQRELLRKVITADREIVFNNAKIMKQDSQKFIDFLSQVTNARTIDSWDVWRELGWLTIAYWINTIILLLSLSIVVCFVIVKGFDSRLLLFAPLLFSQLFFYQGQMKNKINN